MPQISQIYERFPIFINLKLCPIGQLDFEQGGTRQLTQ
jgi:hypothetical protein